MRDGHNQSGTAKPQPAVIVMLKAPRAGEVKTRLAQILSEADAASLAACFAQDAVASARRIARDVIVAYTPSDGRHILRSILPHDLLWMEQEGAGLGARLGAAVGRAAALGFSPLIVTGTDSPTLPPVLIETAIGALGRDEVDLVLGPTEDGGYYLVGLSRPVPHLFQNIAWSTSLVYQQTVDTAARLGLRIRELPRWYDVDVPADLLRLRDELLADREAQERAQFTYRWLLAHERDTRLRFK
jgi:hypothetical protein